MSLDDDGRSFERLSPREAQQALADEFRTDKPMSREDKSSAVEWSPEERAEQERMTEALLFAATEPLDEATIAERLPAGADVAGALAALALRYEGRGVSLARISGKWRFTTATDLAHLLEREQVRPRKLSRAALETLAIIAYHQPCTRADIEDVRGVAVAKGSLDQLMEIGWVRMRGRRKEALGRPILYGTTQSFLEHFGLESVGDLPGQADLKAAGLLDARLPAGFAVPAPLDGGEEFGDDGDADADARDFAEDFLDEKEG
jgi:segregation and condensation protein B